MCVISHGSRKPTSCFANELESSYRPIMAKPLTRSQTAALARDLQTLLDRLRDQDLEGSTGMMLRIEGAVKALQIVLGEADPSELV